MAEPLRVLLVEDAERDALLLVDQLRRGGYEPLWRRVASADGLETALEESWDVVISDGRATPPTPPYVIKALRDRKLDVPLIVVSATADEAAMVDAMRAGAHDYMQKGNVKRLVPAIRRELADAVERRARRAAEWVAAESARQLEREIREQKDVLETLNRAGRLLSAELNLERLAQGVTDAATELSGGHLGVFFYDVEDEDGERRMLCARSGASREAFSDLPMPPDPVRFGPTFRGEAAVRIDDVGLDPRWGPSAPFHGVPAGRLPVTSYLAVPVVSRSGDLLGGLFFAHAEAGAFGEREERLVVGLATQAAVAMDNARLYRQAQEASRMKDEFLATLSHELRTPLNAILGWAQLLREGRLDGPTTARAVQTIERNARAQTRLISNILDVSRIVSGRLRLDVRPVELVRPVEAALDTVRPAAEARGIELQTELDAGAGIVAGDVDRLQQVAWNLLSNAIKFTPHGGRVTVRLARVDSQVQLTVQDSGIGIDADFLPHVFERFRQGDGSSTRPQGGLGLGLALVRHLVEMHGGTVHAASPGRDRGATLTVRLPVMRDSRAPAPARAVPTPEIALSPILDAPLSGVTVLLVDDEADARDLFKTVLEGSGARVTAVASGSEAYSSFTADPPDVVVSDIEMPDENGYELIRRLRGLPPERGGRTPAAALTAYARAEDRMHALQAGFQRHVSKPVQPAELVAVVASLVRRHY